MTRLTSMEAYQEIQSSGLLGKRQKHAYNVLYEHGPLTGNELSEEMKIPGQWKRCSELKNKGLVIEVGERRCSVTGVNCYIWDVTGEFPKKQVINTQDEVIKINKRLKKLELKRDKLLLQLRTKMSL